MEHVGADSPEPRRSYTFGDVVTTLVRTVSRQTISITYDTNSPRPYGRKLLAQGTRGLVGRYHRELIQVEGRSPAHEWEDLEGYRAEYEHPLWRAVEERSRRAGHGGLDCIEDNRLVSCLWAGTAMAQDVYDGAVWSAVSELSERSIAGGSRPVEFPDFPPRKYCYDWYTRRVGLAPAHGWHDSLNEGSRNAGAVSSRARI